MSETSALQTGEMAAYGMHGAPYRHVTSQPDVHEMMKWQAFSGRNPRCDTHFEKSRPCPDDKFGVSDIVAVMDSWLLSSPPDWKTGKFPFTFAIGQQSGKGNVGVFDTIHNVIQIQVGEGFMAIPELVDIDSNNNVSGFSLAPSPGTSDPRTGDNPLTSGNTQLPFGGRITMYLKEVGKQAYSDRNSRNHHIEFDTEIVGSSDEPNAFMRLTPVNELYTFTQPIQDISQLTLEFYNPDETVRFPVDTLWNITLSMSPGGANMPPLNTLILNAPSITGDNRDLDFSQILDPGDRIFIEGLEIDTSVDEFSVLGSMQRYINKKEGLFIGNYLAYPGLEPNQITLDPLPNINTTIANNIRANPDYASGVIKLSKNGVLRIAKNRMRIPFRMRRVLGKTTNYIDP